MIDHEPARVEPDDPHNVLDRFGRDLLRLSERSRQRLLGHAFAYWRRRGFPYPEVSSRELESDVAALRRVVPERVLVGNEATASTVGLRLANAYHPQIWEIPRHGRSAVDCFGDDRRLRLALIKAVHFYADRRCWNARCLRAVLRIHHRSRVANFRPAVARALYARYSNDGGRLLDFSAGFGGRLLAALTLNRQYIGIDPAVRQVAGLRRMAADLEQRSSGSSEIIGGCAEDILPLLPGKSHDLILSSPPYFDTEEYDSSPPQSCHRYQSYADWCEGFLQPIIEQGCRVLKPGAYFLINVKDQPGCPIATDARRFFPRSYRPKPTIRLLLSALPHIRAGNGSVYRWEPILVLRRPHQT